MTSCRKCGSTSAKTRALAASDLADLGIPVRVEDGAMVVTCEHCGHSETSIENMNGLILAAAVCLAFVPYKLSGDEIRFCRKAMGMTAKEISAKLDVKPETVSRWENQKQPITDALEKMFRMHVAEALKDRAPNIRDFSLETILTLALSPVRSDSLVPTLAYGRNRSPNNDHGCSPGTGKFAEMSYQYAMK